MTVLLADRRLSVRRQLFAESDGHGGPVPDGWGSASPSRPGRAIEGPDVAFGESGGRTWTIAVDPANWPVYQGDLVVDADSGEEWLVTSADLMTNTIDPYVNYIRIEAHAYTAGTKP